VSSLASQEIVEVVRHDIEDGLSERICKNIARDTFGYFYLFNDSSVQRYDGQEFSDVRLDERLQQFVLGEYTLVSANSGGVIAISDHKDIQLYIPPASLTAFIITEGHTQWHENRNPRPKHTYLQGGKEIVIKSGSFWTETKGEAINLTDHFSVGMNCIASTQDREGNIIAVMGRSRLADIILVYTSAGDLLDYSELINVNDKIIAVYSDNLKHQLMLGTYNGLFICNLKRSGIENYYVKIWHIPTQFRQSDFTKICRT